MDADTRDRRDHGSDVPVCDPGLIVGQVPALCVPAIWSRVRPFIAAALAHSAGHMRPEDVLDDVVKGDRQLWAGRSAAGVEAVCVTRVAEYPSTRALWVMESAGNLEAVQHFWPVLRDYATRHQCKTVCFMGRRGWRQGGVLPMEFRHTSDLWVAEV